MRTARRSSVRALVSVASVLLLLAALLLVAPPASASHDVTTDRVAGEDRFATAARIAHAAFPDGADVVFVARGDVFPDGLAAAPLAAQAGGPVLLVRTDDVPQATRNALDALGVEEVVVLGGTAAISEEVQSEMAAAYSVERVAGANRYATAAAIARATAAGGQIGEIDGLRTAFVASGANFPDALAAGAPAAAAAAGQRPLPVLLSSPAQLPTVTADLITDLDVEQAFVVGGEQAVSSEVADALDDLGVRVERLAGADRQATAARVADFTIAHLDAAGDRVVLARGNDFPDVLAAGPYAGLTDAPILLTRSPQDLGANTAEWFDSACLLVGDVEAVGGPMAVPDEVLDEAAVTARSCHGTWGSIPEAPIAEDRVGHSATWTGDRMIIWGGQPAAGLRAPFDDGAAWDPQEREWRQIPPAPIDPRFGHHASWIGEELLVWGGQVSPGFVACHADGARYDPITGTWQAVGDAPGGARCDPATVWTGDELIAFGGTASSGEPRPDEPDVLLGDAVAYDPDGDAWRTLPDAPLDARAHAIAAWTGTEVLVLGGRADGVSLSDGAAYEPQTDRWRSLPDLPDAVDEAHDDAWTGQELVVLGGEGAGSVAAGRLRHAAAYDPETDSWRELADLPEPLSWANVTWTGDSLYVLGEPAGEESASLSLLAYSAADDAWLTLPDPPVGARIGDAAVWSGEELLVWGATGAATSASAGLTWRPPDLTGSRAARGVLRSGEH